MTDALQLHEATEAIAQARAALERLAALSGADSHVKVSLGMPWEPGDKPTLRIEIATVSVRVNQCQRTIDIREWSGPTAESIAEQLTCGGARPCVCDRCEARRRATERYAELDARPPIEVFAPREDEEEEEEEEPESPAESLLRAHLERLHANDA